MSRSLCARRLAARLVLIAFVAAPVSALTPDVRPGDSGPAVERLQKLLNARLDPSPGLTVDGDFGDATLGALRRYQREINQPETATDGASLWQALGPL